MDKPFCGISDADILTRLVALNRERAEEEKQGLIRWLRPEYQAPAKAMDITAQVGLTVSLGLEVIRTEPDIAMSVDIQPWPKERRPQLAALRALVQSDARLWDLEALAGAFKSRGRYRDSIQAHLDVLEDLGLVERLETPQGPRWHRPTAAVG